MLRVDILCAYPLSLHSQEDKHAFDGICAEHSGMRCPVIRPTKACRMNSIGNDLKLELAHVTVFGTTVFSNIGSQKSGAMAPRTKLSAKRLTLRQQEVVKLLAEGKTMSEAALLLNLTKSGVAFHKYRVMQKLKLKRNADLIRFAIQSRLLAS